MSFIDRIEESPARLVATALTLNLMLSSWILDRFLDTSLIAFALNHPQGDILIFTIIVLLILTYMIAGKSGLLMKFFSFFD
ncbi:hypothetical protein [Acinetobacter sp. YH01009]|uniref:hypothetical protein n=1 Tax=Acinetobacter sp. YH01009 TaxID=2601025 RepID=UPI0015D3FDE5|nr:hypothetical protein [Acinetobacter sp. YH01009]